MIEDTTLTQFIVESIDPTLVISSATGEKAYSLKTVNHGECKNEEEEQSKLAEAEVTPNTLGFELDFEVDMCPNDLVTYTADKQINGHFVWGDHAPGEKNYQEKCRFKSGEKVLCLMCEGYDVVLPAIVVGPLTCEYLEELHRTSNDPMVSAQSSEEFIDSWHDWNWDSVIVRPLVRLKNDWEEMDETIVVNRVYLFPYKKFEI